MWRAKKREEIYAEYMREILEEEIEVERMQRRIDAKNAYIERLKGEAKLFAE